MWGLSYPGLTVSISWLLMPWLLASPGHQHPWCWLCKLGKSLSYMRKDFNYLCHVIVEEWYKLHLYIFMSPLKNLAHQRLIKLTVFVVVCFVVVILWGPGDFSHVNSFSPWQFERKFRQIIFKFILVIDSSSISCDVAIRWISLNLTDELQTLADGTKPLP